ncbi:MAG: hypothetical protein KDK91_11115, partial [Gammaproteobacteria bacterium]|nr:hypothetical protein [Gammaproteobacteria bacterium]
MSTIPLSDAERSNAVWDQVRMGHHVLLLGALAPSPADWAVLEVDCAAVPVGEGPLLHAIRELDRLGPTMAPVANAKAVRGEPAGSARISDTLSDRSGFDLVAASRIGPAGSRSGASIPDGAAARLLGESEVTPLEVRFVEACNRLAASAVRPSAVVLRHVEHCDESTNSALLAVLSHPGWLALPVVLQSDASAVDQPLAAAIETAGGQVLHAPSGAGATAPGGAAEPSTASAAQSTDRGIDRG